MKRRNASPQPRSKRRPGTDTKLPSVRNINGYAQATIGGINRHLGRYGTRAAQEKLLLLLDEYEQQQQDEREQQARARQAKTGAEGGKPGIRVEELLLRHVRKVKQEYGAKSNPFYRARAMAKLVCESPRIPDEGDRKKPCPFVKLTAARFTVRVLTEFRESLIASGRHSRQYINQIIKDLRRVFRLAELEELVPPGTYANLQSLPPLRKKKRDRPLRETVTQKDVRVPDDVIDAVVKTLSESRQPVVADMVRLQRLLGCRPTELCQMKPHEIDRTDAVWIYQPTDHKTDWLDEERAIAIGPRAQEILSKYLLRDEVTWCFESKPGQCYTEDSYRNAVKRAGERTFAMPDRWRRHDGESAEVWKLRLQKNGQRNAMERWRKRHHFTPNLLRHCRGTEVRQQFGLEHAAATLGHKDIETTKVYAVRDAKLAVEAASRTG